MQNLYSEGIEKKSFSVLRSWRGSLTLFPKYFKNIDLTFIFSLYPSILYFLSCFSFKWLRISVWFVEKSSALALISRAWTVVINEIRTNVISGFSGVPLSSSAPYYLVLNTVDLKDPNIWQKPLLCSFLYWSSLILWTFSVPLKF